MNEKVGARLDLGAAIAAPGHNGKIWLSRVAGLNVVEFWQAARAKNEGFLEVRQIADMPTRQTSGSAAVGAARGDSPLRRPEFFALVDCGRHAARFDRG